MNWATAIQQPAPAKPSVAEPCKVAAGTTAVLDASAVISGFSRAIVDNLTTIPAVLAECKDAVAKQRLQLLPEGISILQPSADSIQTVSGFAKLVGEYHTLSRVDLHLLALAHTLESALHGESHLRKAPLPPRAAAKRPSGQDLMPGWGSQGSQWAAMDALEDAEACAHGSGADIQAVDASRISGRVEALTLEADPAGQREAQLGTSSSASSDDEGDNAASSADDGVDWAVAAKSNNAARQQRRRQQRRSAREEAACAVGHAVHSNRSASVQPHLDHAHLDQDATQDDAEDHPHDNVPHDDESGHSSDTVHEEGAGSGPCPDCVAIVTGDYAMQNVALQMGMRLLAPDGARTTHISRWALRCSACFKVSLEHGRLFCERCGNAALDKVEVVVGPGGLQQYGVRKMHNLRGTRFTLPKPKGGKTAQPILREDVLLQKMPKVRKPQNETPDAFVPEYSQDNWYKQHIAGSSRHANQVEAAASLGHAKRNPNERWCSRSNRRK